MNFKIESVPTEAIVPVVDMGDFPWGILLMLGIVVVLVTIFRILLK